MNVFRRAVRPTSHARLALVGPPGAGVTRTSLRLAAGFGGRVVVIDTNRGRSETYADDHEFDVLPAATYSPASLVTALAYAYDGGYDTVIVDSLSAFWSGPGGVLDIVDGATRRGLSRDAAWSEARGPERRMWGALLAFPGHLIVTMRARVERALVDEESGKRRLRTVDVRVEQREGVEYDLHDVWLMDAATTVVTKTACPALQNAVISEPGVDTAATLLDWLVIGTPPDQPPLDEIRRQVLSGRMSADDLVHMHRSLSSGHRLGVALLGDGGEPTTLAELVKAAGEQARAREEALRRRNSAKAERWMGEFAARLGQADTLSGVDSLRRELDGRFQAGWLTVQELDAMTELAKQRTEQITQDTDDVPGGDTA